MGTEPRLTPTALPVIAVAEAPAAEASVAEAPLRGLYVCKQIVDAHGGVIGVTSTPGDGARFHVELPVARG